MSTRLRPYRARRARRCAMAPACPHGGRIRPGQLVLRWGRHNYVHAECPELAGQLLVRTWAQLQEATRQVAAAAAPVVASIHALVVNVETGGYRQALGQAALSAERLRARA